MSSGFITESEVLEQRRQRQEEWDKVRTEDQPKEAPDEPYDTRPLFTRLEEQRLKKEAEYEEAHKLKNMIRGLDDGEVGFLELVERSKAEAARQISLDDQKEMDDFRSRVCAPSESEEMLRLRAQLAPPAAPRAPPAALRNKLHGVVVRKRKASETEDSKDAPAPKQNGVADDSNKGSDSASPVAAAPPGSALRCVAVLPGLGHYDGTDSSSDTDSSDSDESQCEAKCTKGDLLPRAEPKGQDSHKS